MAEIPNADNIQRRVGYSRRGVASVPNQTAVLESTQGSNAVSSAFGQLGETLHSVGIDMHKVEEERKERETRLAVVNAKSKFFQANIGAKQGIDDDDYDTYVNRYGEGIGKAKSELLETIKDPYARELLSADFDLTIEEGNLAMYNKSFNRERSLGRAATDNTIETQLETLSLAETDSDHELGLQVIKESIQGAQKSNYYSAEEAENAWDMAKESYAFTRLNGMDAESQVQALENDKGWVSNIPASKRVVAKKRARKEVESNKKANETDILRAKSVVHVDDWADLDLTEDEMYDKAAKLPAKERLYAEDRIAKTAARDEEIRVDNAYDAYDTWHKNISGDAEGQDPGILVSFDDIPQVAKDDMTPAQRNSLKALSNERYNKVPVRTISDQDVKDVLYVLSEDETTEGRRKLRDYFSGNEDKLNQKDRDTWSKASAKMFEKVPVEIKGLLTARQKAKALGKEGGLNDNRLSSLDLRMDKWYRDFRAVNEGKAPTPEQEDKAIDQFLMEDGDWFSFNERAFEEGFSGDITIEYIKITDPVNYKKLLIELQNEYGDSYEPEQLVRIWKGRYANQ